MFDDISGGELDSAEIKIDRAINAANASKVPDDPRVDSALEDLRSLRTDLRAELQNRRLMNDTDPDWEDVRPFMRHIGEEAEVEVTYDPSGSGSYQTVTGTVGHLIPRVSLDVVDRDSDITYSVIGPEASKSATGAVKKDGRKVGTFVCAKVIE